MAPIRRYLRITKYSVLECRIYLDNPGLAESWLLNPRDPVLPRVIESVRPLVLPKLREENERSRAKKGKKKSVKDVVTEEDFEVSIFLTETGTRHSLLTKQKHFRDPPKKDLQSASDKLTGNTHDTAIEVNDAPAILREESEEGGLNLSDLLVAADSPAAESVSDAGSLFVDDAEGHQGHKRRRGATNESAESSPSFEPIPKKRRDAAAVEEDDDKKRMAMDTSYEGFSIYGRVLCLIVTRIDKKGKGSISAGQAIMEDWIISTQMPPDNEDS